MKDTVEKKEKNSLCLCITTYRRWRVIQDFLEKCASYYLDAGIDIYIYDSSDDSETKRVVDQWEDKNKEKVYYIRVPSELHANMKVYKIWQFYGFKKQYDFVWMAGDSFQLSGQAVETVMENLNLSFDMIELDVFDNGETGCRLYTQPNELFVEDAWKITLFGTLILNAHTVLEGVDWHYYEAKYSEPKLINYSHVSFCFNRAVELNDFQCIHLPLSKGYRRSEYKKEAGWRKETFWIICKGWVTTVKELPDCYSDRKKVILDLGVKAVLPNKYVFWKYKQDGVYDIYTFLRYFWMWRRICNVKYGDLVTIAFLNFKDENKIYNLENRRFVDRLNMFKRNYKDIYLYGAGIVGERYGKFLFKNGLEYKGYVVARISDDQKLLNGHRIIELGELGQNHEIGIVVSVSERLVREVRGQLQECGFGKQIFYCPELSDWIKYTEQME